jgi:gamma-glutamylcyclotransferase (GGCT)/AIG2-like uncharacterized protein YtfP
MLLSIGLWSDRPMQEPKDRQTRIFVYGTLKPGEANFDRYCQNALKIQAAIAYGTLYDLPLGYPAMTPGNSPVYGFLLSFAHPQILLELDELEDYRPDRPMEENEYYRKKIQTFSPSHQSLGDAWVYLMELEKAKRLGGVLLSEGLWKRHE